MQLGRLKKKLDNLKNSYEEIKNYTRLTIKRSPSNRNNIEIYKGNIMIASYNADISNKSSGIVYFNPSSRRHEARHGDAPLEGTLKGLTAGDIRNFARFIAENPGSENQYTYGVTEDGQLFSIQNTAQRVTKDLNESDALMQSLWAEEGFAPEGDNTYEQNAYLSVW